MGFYRVLSFAVVISSAASFSVFASDTNHILGGNIGYGTQEFESKNGQNIDAGDTFTADVYYRYMLNDSFGIEAGLMSGTGGVVDALLDVITDVKDLSYKGIRSAVFAQYSLSQGNSLYAKAGATYHELSYTVDSNNIDDKDSGLYGALGWQYRFLNGFGLNAEYQYIPMQKLEVNSFSVGLSYRF